jgi:collagen type VI alpha
VGTWTTSEGQDLEKTAAYPPWKPAIPLESFLQLSLVRSKLRNWLWPEIEGVRAFPPREGLYPTGREEWIFHVR